jgi:hypothetical protein
MESMQDWTQSVLKARATLAWGEAPGNRHAAIGGLKARAKSPTRHKLASPTFHQKLIPHKPLIELHPILRKHRSHLGLEIPPLMVRDLCIDVPHQCHPITQPHRERRIPALPAELRKLRPLRLDPFGRRHLEPLHHSRDRFRPSNKQGNMDVVGDSTNPHANVFGAIEDRSQIRVHLRSDCIVQKRTPRLRTEYHVHQHIRERLRHGCEYSASLQPAMVSTHPDLGLCPRLPITRAFSPQTSTLTHRRSFNTR